MSGTGGTTGAPAPATEPAPTGGTSTGIGASLLAPAPAPPAVTTHGLLAAPWADISEAGIIMTIMARRNLSNSNRAKYMGRLTKGLELKFGLMSPVEGKMAFEQVYNLEARLLVLQNHMCLHSMLDVFEIWTLFDGTGNIMGNGCSTSLFSNYSTVTLDMVQRSNEFYRQYSVDENSIGENLSWSQLLIANSCEDKIRERIEEKVRNIPTSQ